MAFDYNPDTGIASNFSWTNGVVAMIFTGTLTVNRINGILIPTGGQVNYSNGHCGTTYLAGSNFKFT